MEAAQQGAKVRWVLVLDGRAETVLALRTLVVEEDQDLILCSYSGLQNSRLWTSLPQHGNVALDDLVNSSLYITGLGSRRQPHELREDPLSTIQDERRIHFIRRHRTDVTNPSLVPNVVDGLEHSWDEHSEGLVPSRLLVLLQHDIVEVGQLMPDWRVASEKRILDEAPGRFDKMPRV